MMAAGGKEAPIVCLDMRTLSSITSLCAPTLFLTADHFQDLVHPKISPRTATPYLCHLVSSTVRIVIVPSALQGLTQHTSIRPFLSLQKVYLR
jgi:hypothetical protein